MRLAISILALAVLTACSANSTDHIALAVNDSGRPEADMQRDAGRHPAEMLTFAGVQPGWRVADLGAGSGYYSRILSSAVGVEGLVVSENMDWIVERFPQADEAIMALAEERDNVERLVTPVTDILSGYDNELDAAFMMLIYHDQAWVQEGFEAPTREDRLAMNTSIFNALRPGGVFLVVDHRAEDGTGDSVVGDYHRIDEAFVREEIEAAGFELADESDVLSNPDDTRTISVFDPSIRGNTDRFVLLYRKPL
jgi:predicted methyltransferase